MRIYYFGELIADSEQSTQTEAKSSSPVTLVGDILKSRPDYSDIARGMEKNSSDTSTSGLGLTKIPATPDLPSEFRICFSDLAAANAAPLSDKTDSDSLLDISGCCEVFVKPSKFKIRDYSYA